MLSFIQLILLLFVIISGLAVSLFSGLPLVLGFLPGLLFLLYLCLKLGYTFKFITSAMYYGFLQIKGILWILAFVSLIIPVWIASGTVPLMISIGLSLMNHTYFITCAFIITAGIALLLGTSTGTLSMIGVPLLGVGTMIGIPAPLIAGALISGAFVGDRTSPLSSANQLVASCTGLTSPQQTKTLLPTTILAILISLLFFVTLDWETPKTVAPRLTTMVLSQENLWVLLPPFLLIISILFRSKIQTAFLLGIASGLILGTVYQQISLFQWTHYLLFGFEGTTLTSKGLLNMLPLMLFISLTAMFNGITEQTNLIQFYIEKVLGPSKSLTSTTIRLCLFGLALNIFCCNQTLPIILSSRSFLPIWEKWFSISDLSRITSDSSLIYAGLIPWNMLGMIASNILGIKVTDYLVYAVFLWFLPFATVGWSFYKEAVKCAQQ